MTHPYRAKPSTAIVVWRGTVTDQVKPLVCVLALVILDLTALLYFWRLR